MKVVDEVRRGKDTCLPFYVLLRNHILFFEAHGLKPFNNTNGMEFQITEFIY